MIGNMKSPQASVSPPPRTIISGSKRRRKLIQANPRIFDFSAMIFIVSGSFFFKASLRTPLLMVASLFLVNFLISVFLCCLMA